MSRRSPFLLFILSKVFSSSAGKLSSATVEYVRLVMQCQLHQSSVMPQWTLDQLWVMVGIFFMTFHWWYLSIFLVLGPESSPGVHGGSVSRSHSVRSFPSSRDRNWRGQLPMSECPSTQEMAKRHTHSCLLTLVWVTVLPPSELHGHASRCQSGNDTELQVGDTHTWGKCGLRPGLHGYIVITDHQHVMPLEEPSAQTLEWIGDYLEVFYSVLVLKSWCLTTDAVIYGNAYVLYICMYIRNLLSHNAINCENGNNPINKHINLRHIRYMNIHCQCGK